MIMLMMMMLLVIRIITMMLFVMMMNTIFIIRIIMQMNMIVQIISLVLKAIRRKKLNLFVHLCAEWEIFECNLICPSIALFQVLPQQKL